MIKSQIIARGITDSATIEAMRKVPRHQFVPILEAPFAYQDRPLPIGSGQTISQPYIVAYMTEQLMLHEKSRVLEIGTGSGYQAAVLAEIVSEVYTVEIIPELATEARKCLTKLGYDKVHIKEGDGYYGWEEYAPFDAIIVTAAAEAVPPHLVEQLRSQGKMIIPIGGVNCIQNLILVTKEEDRILQKPLLPVRFVPFTRRNNSQE